MHSWRSLLIIRKLRQLSKVLTSLIGSSLCSEKERNLVRNTTNVHKPPFCDFLDPFEMK